MIDDGQAVHYTAVTEGTPVFSSDEVEVGRVFAVLDNYTEHIFDGLVIERERDDLRFVDAPEVARTAERAVTLAISSAEVEHLPPPPDSAPSFKVNRRAGRISRRLGRGWKRG